MNFKATLKDIIRKILHSQKRKIRLSWKHARYTFCDRSKGREKLCILLAGYKSFLYPVTFERIRRFMGADIDMCVCSSGLYSCELDELCEKNGWSYLYTKRNNVCLIQNLAIHNHPKAAYIYKLDEDIFVTKGSFSTLLKTLKECKENGDYIPAFVAPLLPINGYCHLRILQKFNLVEKYSKLFEKPRHAIDIMVETNQQVAKFFWGGGGFAAH